MAPSKFLMGSWSKLGSSTQNVSGGVVGVFNKRWDWVFLCYNYAIVHINLGARDEWRRKKNDVTLSKLLLIFLCPILNITCFAACDGVACAWWEPPLGWRSIECGFVEGRRFNVTEFGMVVTMLTYGFDTNYFRNTGDGVWWLKIGWKSTW